MQRGFENGELTENTRRSTQKATKNPRQRVSITGTVNSIDCSSRLPYLGILSGLSAIRTLLHFGVTSGLPVIQAGPPADLT
jgi:hypothetical protein